MKNQTLSIEQMKHLKDLGVDDSKASMIYCIYKDITDEWTEGDDSTPGHFKIDESSKEITCLSIRDGNETLYDDMSDCSNYSCCELIPAFTLQDMLEILSTVEYESIGFPMLIFSHDYHLENWDVCFRNPVNFDNPEIRSNTPLRAFYRMLCYLAENGHLKGGKP